MPRSIVPETVIVELIVTADPVPCGQLQLGSFGSGPWSPPVPPPAPVAPPVPVVPPMPLAPPMPGGRSAPASTPVLPPLLPPVPLPADPPRPPVPVPVVPPVPDPPPPPAPVVAWPPAPLALWPPAPLALWPPAPVVEGVVAGAAHPNDAANASARVAADARQVRPSQDMGRRVGSTRMGVPTGTPRLRCSGAARCRDPAGWVAAARPGSG